MKISLIHPSRGRAKKAKETYDYWISQSSGEVEIEHILSIDFGDSETEYHNVFSESNSNIITNNNLCVVEATNEAAKISSGDILIYLSDDFKCPVSWDLAIVSQFGDTKEPMLLKVDDCLQRFVVAVLTIPIMNRELYEKLGCFWHPEYRSMFVDEDLYWTCKNNNWLIFCEDLKFPHEHPCNGLAENDETYKRSAANWEQGKAVFAKRKQLNFPV